MAVITSHTLDGSDGTHADGIPVVLTNLSTRTVLFSAVMDDGGRLSQSVDPSLVDPSATWELVFDLAAYWVMRGRPASVTQIVLRFTMPDPDGAYHLPVIVNPNSYSMWSSS